MPQKQSPKGEKDIAAEVKAKGGALKTSTNEISPVKTFLHRSPLHTDERAHGTTSTPHHHASSHLHRTPQSTPRRRRRSPTRRRSSRCCKPAATTNF
mmetsp:Transcript_91582/g.261766  ORF Transcript_91582/g.261766 Transcript_91582/m.261766 type:complete len:97 (+) Transcript_91582:117-407(+)